VQSIAGRTVAVFTTAPAAAHATIASHLGSEYGARVQQVSGALARRPELLAELDSVEAEVIAVELKAAAIDVVAEVAERQGRELVLLDNEVVPLPGEDLDGALRELAREALVTAVTA
jgi:cyclic 2,3-diphosphoglycerate synthetase